MRFHELPLRGAYLVDLDRITDHRGFNARAWCAREFAEAGLPIDLAQVNVIGNGPAGTLRGFHYQVPPHAETKLFRVTRGAVFDVIIDLRPESATFGKWLSVELHADDYRMLFVPERFGQGFQTLEDDTELIYQVSSFYAPEHGRGFRHDDPALGISWPRPVTAISDKDRDWPDLDLPAAAQELRQREAEGAQP